VNSLEIQGKINASSVADYYRSKQTGNWQAFATWESSANNTTWMNATLAPTSSATSINIPTGHTVTSTADIALSNTSIAGSLVIASNTSISVPATKTLNITGSVLLKSDATGTATIAASQGTITGEVTAERYCSNKRAYRFMAPGLTTTTSIYTNWQNGGNNIASTGTHITGDIAGGNGFDATATGAPSLYAFDNATQLWKAFGIGQTAPYNNTNSNTLKAGEAYRLFVRGDRSINLNSNTSAGQTTLVTKGAPFIGSYIFNNTSSPVALSNTVNNWNFIGNPYLSEVDWKSASLTRTDLSSAFYIWDLSLGTRGAYAYFDAADNSFTGAATQYIQPGQAIFVQTTGSAPSLVFTENAKADGHNSNTAFRNTGSTGLLSVKLSYMEAGQSILADQANAVFSQQAAKGRDGLDVEKMTNLDENIAFNIQGSNFIKDARPAMEGSDELQLSFWQLKKRTYTITITSSGMEADAAYLEDNYLHTSTPIAINGSTNVSFEVNDEAASSAKDRFRIVLKGSASMPLVSASQFSATLAGTIGNTGFQLLLSTKEAGAVSIRVSNLLGQQLAAQKVYANAGQQTVSVSTDNLGSGLYLIELSQGTDRIVLKAIKQ
jgi:hypothetical protein